MAQPPLVQAPFPNVPANDVGRLIDEAIRFGHAVRADATRNPNGSWSVLITRPANVAGGAGGN